MKTSNSLYDEKSTCANRTGCWVRDAWTHNHEQWPCPWSLQCSGCS